MEKGRGDGESGASRWPTVGGRSQAANWEPARGGGREVLIGVDGGGGSWPWSVENLPMSGFASSCFFSTHLLELPVIAS